MGVMEQIPFDPANAAEALKQLPRAAAVFVLYGADAHTEPYIGRTPNLRGRLERLLQPSAKHPRRLQLAGRVRRIEWQPTGSEFESLLAQFSLLEKAFGAKALERMHLRAPAFVRYLGGNPYPRITVTHKPSQREAGWAYGPFPSRAAAERYAEEALKLFLLRRCVDDLNPDPSFPGCVYSEMKMCLAPCYKGCTDERYAEEAAAVESFFATRGESRLVILRGERDHASADLEFESAAALHAQVQKVESVRALAGELVRPMNRLRAAILQQSANPGEVAVFVFDRGSLRGPAPFSTIGMRIQNEQSGSTSLFAQPLAIEAVPESREQGTGIREQGIEGPRDQGTEGLGTKGLGTKAEEIGAQRSEIGADAPPAAARSARGALESRLEAALASLAEPGNAPSATVRQAHLSLLKRWYYRPEARREGEIFFPDDEGRWPLKAILRGVGRVAAKMVAAGARRDPVSGTPRDQAAPESGQPASASEL
jgi:excinuclease ABC subunit C